MKVSELQGAMLDYWVAKAEGLQDARISGEVCRHTVIGTSILYSPSTDWSQGGPIIERNRIDFMTNNEGALLAAAFSKTDNKPMFGETYLIAAMRCYVASEYGDEVSDE